MQLKALLTRPSSIPVFLAGAILLVFGGIFQNTFLNWDDTFLILSNPIVTHPNWKILNVAFQTLDPEFYTPLTLTAFRIIYQIFGPNAIAFHAASLLLHFLNALLLFVLFKALTIKKRWAFLGALLFAIHPMNTEAVAWIAALKHPLSSCFALLSMIIFLQYSTTRKSRWLATSIGFFGAALLCNVTVAFMPFVFGLYISLLQKKKPTAIHFVALKPFLVLSFCALLVGILPKIQYGTAVFTSVPFHFAFSESVVFYLKQFFLPLHLSIEYAFPQPEVATTTLWIQTITVLSATILIWMKRKKHPSICFGWFAFLILLVPAIAHSLQQGTLPGNDRHAYLAYVGLILCFVPVARGLCKKSKRVACAALCIWLLFLSIRTMERVRDFRHSEALYQSLVEGQPEYPNGYYYLATTLMRDRRLLEAKGILEEAKTKFPDNEMILSGIGAAYALEENVSMSEKYIQILQSLPPTKSTTYEALTLLYKATGNNLMSASAFSMATSRNKRYHRAGIILLQQSNQ